MDAPQQSSTEPTNSPTGVTGPVPQPNDLPPHKRSGIWQILLMLVLVLAIAATGWWLLRHDGSKDTKTSSNQSTNKTDTVEAAGEPNLSVVSVATGREHVWGIGFLPSGELLFTERKGAVNAIVQGSVREVASIPDVRNRGEGGLMGLAVDPGYAQNSYIYTCFNTTAGDIKVVRWKVKQDLSGLEERKDIVTGMPANPSGRHSGCQLAFGLDKYLWVGTGDTAQDITPQTPQDPKSLGGKILRIDRDGKAAPGNYGHGFDARVYSYGHRNTQGLAFFAAPRNGVPGASAEHGTGVDDEINPLKPGNFGWAPPNGPYDENVPMTDKGRFPDAVEAIWSSGDPTQAPSGMAVLQGKQWRDWEGALAVAMLKDEHLKILQLSDQLKVTNEIRKFVGEYGRLRAVAQGADGSLYIGSSNGSNDRILRITPN